MKGFHQNIEEITISNENFRKVVYTAKHMQLVLMTLKPGEEIGLETHPDNDQFFRFEAGNGKCIIDDNEYEVKDGSGIIIPAGSQHNVINTSTSEPLKMYTIYAPPHHQDQLVHATKEDSEKNDKDFDGQTTE